MTVSVDILSHFELQDCSHIFVDVAFVALLCSFQKFVSVFLQSILRESKWSHVVRSEYRGKRWMLSLSLAEYFITREAIFVAQC